LTILPPVSSGHLLRKPAILKFIERAEDETVDEVGGEPLVGRCLCAAFARVATRGIQRYGPSNGGETGKQRRNRKTAAAKGTSASLTASGADGA
jgi:hypothetical protein